MSFLVLLVLAFTVEISEKGQQHSKLGLEMIQVLLLPASLITRGYVNSGMEKKRQCFLFSDQNTHRQNCNLGCAVGRKQLVGLSE